MKKARTLDVTLTILEAQALIDTVTDCAMEGLEKDMQGKDNEDNYCFEQTWGEEWREKRPAAMRVANRLQKKITAARRRRP